MIYTEDIHQKIMMIHNPNKKWQNFLTNFGAASVITFFIMFLASLFPPIDATQKNIFELRKFINSFAPRAFLILGALVYGIGSSYQNICTLLFRKGIIIGGFDLKIKKYILCGKKFPEGTFSYRRTRLKEHLDDFIEECEELATEYRKEALYLRMKKWIEIEVPEIIEEDREYEKNKFEEYKARHGFLELDLKKEKNKIND